MIDLRLGDYRCIVIDPPWKESGGGRIKRGADRHYPLMSTPEIGKAIIRADAFAPADDCHLWLWVTDKFLADGIDLMRLLGFRFVRTFCWTKYGASGLQIGLGQYGRGSHELCLFGVRGKSMVPKPCDRPSSVVLSRRRRHSQKPDECYWEWFERVSPGPRLEMFARATRPGWDVWGNEVCNAD